jgi:hypothetical protein
VSLSPVRNAWNDQYKYCLDDRKEIGLKGNDEKMKCGAAV